MADTYVFDFEQGSKDQKDLLGGKGANLAEMTNIGLPVPPGFTVTTEACRQYMRRGDVPPGLFDEVARHMQTLEAKMGKRFGDASDPLLVSVRSGAKFSMPGMMDTVLNLGLNDQSVVGLARQSGNERFARDAYRRFIQMFGKIVMGVPAHEFEDAMDDIKERVGATSDTELGVAELDELIGTFKKIIRDKTDTTFPDDP